MGKYMRKPKTTTDVDLSHSPLGVRTRARTLALKRLESSVTAGADYLELRSRRLQKPPLLKQQLQNSKKIPAPSKQGYVCTDTVNPQIEETNPEKLCSPIEPAEEADGCSGRRNGEFEIGDLEIEAFGENTLDLEPRERSTRESTPCSMIRAADSITTPGSSTKRRRSPNASNQRAQNATRNIPTSREMDDFFASAEEPKQRLFIDKYNFDIVNDMPLPGRYEWVKVMP